MIAFRLLMRVELIGQSHFSLFLRRFDKAKKLLDLGAKASFTGLITYEKNDFIRNSLKLFGKIT